jgi:hypothetical protein
MGVEQRLREAENGPVYPILSRFQEIHADDEVVKKFAVFRDVIFDVNGHYHVAVPLSIPKSCPNYYELQREAQTLANLCYALEGQGILMRPSRVLPALLVNRELKKRGSKFVECYGATRPARYRRAWTGLRSMWAETPHVERPAFKIFRFKKGAWPQMILHAVMGAARHIEDRRGYLDSDAAQGGELHVRGNARALPDYNGRALPNGSHGAQEAAFGPYAAHYSKNREEPDPQADGSNGHPAHDAFDAPAGGGRAEDAPKGMLRGLLKGIGGPKGKDA